MPKKNILFLGYWSLEDPLSIATIIPHLRILSSLDDNWRIVYCSVEPKDTRINLESFRDLSKVSHQALSSTNFPVNLLARISDFLLFPIRLKNIIRQENIDIVIARGAMAGSLVAKTCKRQDIPFFVESFEPHAQYMLEAKVWKKWDLRFVFQKRWEQELKEFAAGLMPVSNNYAKSLILEGISRKRIKVVPCASSTFDFPDSAVVAERFRKNLGWIDNIIGIYVGKFGDIYYDSKAFHIFRKAFDFYGDKFRLIILTPNPIEDVSNKLANSSILKENTYVNKVPYTEVPKYLVTADFAFCLHRSHSLSSAFSPIKNAEYWAAGLPILIPENIGDDSDIISREGGGAVFDVNDESSINKGLAVIKSIVDDPIHRENIPFLARKYRNLSAVEEAYRYFLLS